MLTEDVMTAAGGPVSDLVIIISNMRKNTTFCYITGAPLTLKKSGFAAYKKIGKKVLPH